MEVLAEKIAELLDISREAAIASYPMLRGQYVVYRLTTLLTSAACILFVFSAFAGVIFFYIYKDNKRYLTYAKLYELEAMQAKFFLKWFKVSLGFIGISAVLFLLAMFIRAIWCPDIVFLLNLMS